MFVDFAYNGGAGVTNLNISYRPAGSRLDWSLSIIVNVTAVATFSVHAGMEIAQQYGSIGQLEFKIAAVNALFFWSISRVFNETIGKCNYRCFNNH